MKHKIEVEDLENNVYYKMNPEYFIEILDIVNTKQQFSRYIQFHRKDLDEFIQHSTEFLNTQGKIDYRSRLHCIFHNVTEIPKCQTCHEKLLDMRYVRVYEKTPRFCSSKCCMLNEETQHKICGTMKDRYGVEHALQNPEIKERAVQHVKETNLDRYGVESVLSLPEIQQKKEQTNLETYGVKCTLQAKSVKEKIKQHNLETYGVEHPMQNEEVYARSRKTCKELYGDEYPIRTQSVKDKLIQTNRDTYGVDWSFQSENNKLKSKQTCQKNYGTDCALQSPVVQAKIKESLKRNHNVEHNSQIPEVRSSMHKKYEYCGKQFDSSAELCFYIWLVDAGIDFTFQPEKRFSYEHDGKTHFYCPDFQIEDMFFEIKGDHFFKDKDIRSQMVCPYDHSQDSLYEAKHKCMLENDVIIITTAGYLMFQTYVEERYGKRHWEQFKRR